ELLLSLARWVVLVRLRGRRRPALRLALQVLDRGLQGRAVCTPRDRAGKRDADFEAQLVGRPRPAAAEVLQDVVAVRIIDAVALNEVPLDPAGLVIAVVEGVIDLADLGVDEEAD